MKGRLVVDEEERQRVNPFDWQRAFQQVFKQGGFDAVIGNPPYVDIKGLPLFEVSYYFSKYSSSTNRINLFSFFIEKSLSVINNQAFQFSMIIPTALFTQESYRLLRKKIMDNFHIRNITRLPNESFGNSAGDVKVDTAIIVIQKSKPKKIEIIAYKGYDRINSIDAQKADTHIFTEQSDWIKTKILFGQSQVQDQLKTFSKELSKIQFPLSNVVIFPLGLHLMINIKVTHNHKLKIKFFILPLKKMTHIKNFWLGMM